MPKRIVVISSWVALFSCLCLVLSFNGGCTKKETETEYVSAVFLCWLNSGYQSAVLCSDPLADPDDSEVQIEWNSSSVPISYYAIYAGYIAFEADFYLQIATDYTVSLASDVGNCEGTVAIPEETYITAPSYGQLIQLGQNISCTWMESQGADFYFVGYYADAYDSYGYYITEIHSDTCITNYTYTIPANFFNVPGATFYEVYLFVQPNGGAPPVPGTTGNMTGSISGFVNAAGDYDFTYFYVGTPQTKLSNGPQRKEPSVKDRMNTYLRQLGVETVIE